MRDQVLCFFEKAKSHKEIITRWIGENFKIYGLNKKKQGGRRHNQREKKRKEKFQ